jgi:hypothetical protein
MVDLSGIGRNLNADPIVAAQAAQAAGKTNKTEQKRRVRSDRGLGLEDIPEGSAYVPINAEPAAQTAEEAPVEQTEDAGQEALQELDYELVALQALIKKVIARKLALADEHDERKHDLLISAFNDCKNAYLKIEAVRQTLQG